jgi:fatty acid desaturase
MIPEPDDAEQSVRRIRRGCAFSALIVAALSVLFVSSTGNLFYLTLLLVALALVLLSRVIR